MKKKNKQWAKYAQYHVNMCWVEGFPIYTKDIFDHLLVEAGIDINAKLLPEQKTTIRYLRKVANRVYDKNARFFSKNNSK